MRIIVILIIISGISIGCDNQDSCIRVGNDRDFGLDHLAKVELISNHAKALGLPLSSIEAAHIVGSAYAVSQYEGGQAGVPVKICFRLTNAGETQYRVFSLQGKILIEWKKPGQQ